VPPVIAPIVLAEALERRRYACVDRIEAMSRFVFVRFAVPALLGCTPQATAPSVDALLDKSRSPTERSRLAVTAITLPEKLTLLHVPSVIKLEGPSALLCCSGSG